MPDALRYAHVLSFVLSHPWALLPAKYAEIMAFVEAKAMGDEIPIEIVAELRAAAKQKPQRRNSGGVAVLPVFGTISHRMGMMSEFSGGTSVEGLTRDFRTLVNDPDVSAIVLDVDSPGGTVDGLPELADEIYRARSRKPITAVANTLAASGAYWLAASASEIVVSPSALVGSIGVIASHEDRSRLMERLGVNVSLISAGKYKAENNPFEPMTDEGREHFQSLVDESYNLFTRAVARGRGVPVDTVRNGFGEGRVVSAREAVALGMADRIATIDDVVATIGLADDGGQQAARAVSAPLTFENEAAAALTAVRSVQARVEALTALREDRNTPVSQARVPLLMEHRDAYRAVADAYDELVVACRRDAAYSAAHRQARGRLHDLDIWLIEMEHNA